MNQYTDDDLAYLRDRIAAQKHSARHDGPQARYKYAPSWWRSGAHLHIGIHQDLPEIVLVRLARHRYANSDLRNEIAHHPACPLWLAVEIALTR